MENSKVGEKAESLFKASKKTFLPNLKLSIPT